MDYKPTVVLDFDGVIHSYTSPWTTAAEIRDPVVPGAKEFIDDLRRDHKVVIQSTRCTTYRGLVAVSEYLQQNGIKVDDIVDQKVPAIAYIDDRGITFTGSFEGLADKIRNFKPWNRK